MKQIVLLVDDNPIDLMINEKTISRYKEDIEVHKVSGGPQALELLQSNFVPTCILLDIKMPGMNGFEFLAALQETDLEVSYPIHMLSSSIDPADLRAAEESPIVKSYITKPVSADKLSEAGL